MAAIRLMLVDDHDIVRTGLRTFLETQTGFEIIAEAGTGIEALNQIGASRPDVVIMDITMPDMDGLEATRKLKAIAPDCQVLALTIHGDKQYFFEMLAAGASGYLTKQAAPDELVAAIQAVASGQVYLQPILARWLLEDYQRLLVQTPIDARQPASEGGSHKSLNVLSARELQVLELLAQGMTNPQIATYLQISPKTVARHRERIMNKLNLHSCTELVKFAIRTGLIHV
jgi:two-component system response regulator NreC